jgi:hypothetical protein
MSELAVIAPKSIQETAELAMRLSKSALLAEAYRGKEADVFVTLLAGSELGLLPLQSLNAFDVIKGRPAMKPVAMLALVRSHPRVEYARVEASATQATISTKMRGDDFVAKTTFTMEQAKIAGLAGNENYRKFPQQMLTWRCIGLHCRTHHSDIIGGYYTTEEAETFERDVTPSPAVIDAQPAVEAAKAAVKAKRQLVVDVELTAKPTPPSPPLANEDGLVGWGKNSALKLADLETSKVEWYVADAERKATANTNDDREIWVDRMMRYTAELARRGSGEAVAQ